MAGVDCCGVWTFIICSLTACPCTCFTGPRGTLQPLASGSPYFHLTVILSRPGQLSGNLTSSRSRSCRTSQHCWLPQKMETYFLASKVRNWDGKISASHSSCSGKKIYPKQQGATETIALFVWYLAILVARNQQSKKLWENKLKLPVADLDWMGLPQLTQTPGEQQESPWKWGRRPGILRRKTSPFP